MRKLWLIVLFLCCTTMITAQDEYVSPETLADEDGQFAEIDGVSIYYIARGDSDNPAVILIHGFGGSTFTWRDTIDPLVEAGFYVVAVDLPPFGLSDKSPDIGFSRRDYAEYVVGLMDELDIETASIVGHSMGGSTTAYFAVQYSERIDSLVFVAGGIFGAIEGDTTEASEDTSPLGFLGTLDVESEQAVFILETALIPATFASIIETAYYDSSLMTDEVVMGYARPILIEGWAEGFIGYWTASDNDPIQLADLVDVADMPILIMWGENDTWVPLELGLTMQEALPNATLVTYVDTGHLPMEENVEQFNADLIAFLQAN